MLFGLALFVMTLAVGLVMLPGFPRTTLVEAVALTPGAIPYGIGLGFAKVAPAILILGIINTERVRSWRELARKCTLDDPDLRPSVEVLGRALDELIE